MSELAERTKSARKLKHALNFCENFTNSGINRYLGCTVNSRSVIVCLSAGLKFLDRPSEIRIVSWDCLVKLGNLTKLRERIDTKLARDKSLFMVLLTAVHTDRQAKSVSLLPPPLSFCLLFFSNSRDTSNVVVPARRGFKRTIRTRVRCRAHC